jgi:hypothetical protein
MSGDKNSAKRGDEVKVDEDLILELNFVPQWARKPPSEPTYFDDRGAGGGPRRSHRDKRHRPQRDGARGRDRDRRYGAKRRDDQREGGRGRRPPRPPAGGRDTGYPPPSPAATDTGRPGPSYDRPGPSYGRSPRREQFDPSPVMVSFLPKPKGLSFVVHRIHSSRRAFPLTDVAGVFLSNPDYCEVKVEARRGAERARVYQCKTCRMVALTREQLASHILGAHTEEYFVKEEVVGEAPAGAFVCVAKCGLSGVLLGPPNHHSYAEKLQEVHRARFGGMPLEEYRSHVEMVREQEAVDRWKEESRKQVRYRLKESTDGESEMMTWTAVEAHMQEIVVPSLVFEGHRAVLPMETARDMEDPKLREAIRHAWRRESHSPRSLPFALRGAFKHMHLHVFKVGQGNIFVCSVPPIALDPSHAVATIGEVLKHLQAHPGCTRRDMVDVLRPGAGPDSDEVAELLQPLSWLIEKGHIIEFFNGTLSVPLGRARR